MDQKTILITGATGFLGFNIINELSTTEYKLKGFVLKGLDASKVESIGVETIFGDLLNSEDVEKAVSGCDIIIHVAAMTNLWPNRSKLLWDVNVQGTKNLVAAAKKHKIERFLHIGSASSFGYGTQEKPGDEKSPYEGGRYKLDYLDSKKEAQDFIVDEAKNNNFPALVLCPTFMLGGNCTEEGSNSMILAAYNNELPGYTSGGKNFVFVRDVAQAVINAITKGEIGKTFILGNENLTFNEIFTKIASVTGSRVPKLFLPDFAVKIYGLISSLIGHISGKTPKVTYAMSRISCDGHYFSSQKAVRELDMPQTPIEVAIKEAFDHYKNTNIIKE